MYELENFIQTNRQMDGDHSSPLAQGENLFDTSDDGWGVWESKVLQGLGVWGWDLATGILSIGASK